MELLIKNCVLPPFRDPASLLDREIDKELKKDHEKENNIIKLLLLGTGESGKSTFVKQVSPEVRIWLLTFELSREVPCE